MSPAILISFDLDRASTDQHDAVNAALKKAGWTKLTSQSTWLAPLSIPVDIAGAAMAKASLKAVAKYAGVKKIRVTAGVSSFVSDSEEETV